MAVWIDFKGLKEALHFPIVLSHYDISHNAAKTQDMVLCPFHDDETPSCSINKERGMFRCFGCGTQGNVLDFVCEMQDLDPSNSADVVKAASFAITDILGREMSDFGRKAKPKRRQAPAAKTTARKKRRKVADDSAAERQEAAPAEAQTQTQADAKPNPVLTFELQNLVKEHEFFDRRGLGRDTVERFGLGLCGRGLMQGRIVVPVHNAAGELVAYVGRWPEDTVPKGTARYQFPKNFQKTLELFNLHRAVELLGDPRTLFVVEGFWSTIRLHDEAFPTVAVFGQDVSEAQAQLIAAHADRAVLVFDGDEAGRKGIEKAAALLSQHVFTRSVILPEGEKPDTMDVAILQAL